jgi:hypothetical protein
MHGGRRFFCYQLIHACREWFVRKGSSRSRTSDGKKEYGGPNPFAWQEAHL